MVNLLLKKGPWYELLVPTLSTFFLLLYYRISDEFKDLETDKKYFPDRPIPSGRVLLSDLRVLLWGLSIGSLLLNVLFPVALKEFLAAWLFTLLMGKWFFLEKWISSNRLLAFITHAPVGFFLYWYVIRWFRPDVETFHALVLIGYIVLPGFTWEILRKTFLPQDEMPGYQTYSAMLGYKKSLCLATFFILLTAINDILIPHCFSRFSDFILFFFVLNNFLLLWVLVQMFKPIVKNMKTVTEIYMAFHLLLPLGVLIWKTYV
jgi:hypothetical protein